MFSYQAKLIPPSNYASASRWGQRIYLLPLFLLVGAMFSTGRQAFSADKAVLPSYITAAYGKLPMSFEANQGQTDERAKFLSRGAGYTLFLTENSAVLSLRGHNKTDAVLTMTLGGARANSGIAGIDPLTGKSNYFAGRDPKQWRTNVPTYRSVKYTGVYRGIDLIYHGDQRVLEYDFIVAPGADPGMIDIRFQGARKLSIDDDGALVIAVEGRDIIEKAPAVYQDIGGRRRSVAGRYVLRSRDRVGFAVAPYDHARPLVIDPTLVYSFALTGTGDEYPVGIAVDAAGNAYVTGYTTSPNFPTTPGAFNPTFTPGWAAFVSKLNAAGSALVYSTFLGGGRASDIAVDSTGNAFITGLAGDSFPTTPGAFQTAISQAWTGFVTKLNSAGSGLIYSTYISAVRNPGGIALDASGNAYITGAAGYGLPTTSGAFQTTFSGISSTNGFVTKVNSSGSALVYSTYLGMNSWGSAIAVDTSGNAYVAGSVASYPVLGFPTTPGAFQTTFGGGYQDAFISKLNAAGSGLIYSTYLGGPGSDVAAAIAVDAGGNAYVAGAAGIGFPITSGAYQPTINAGAWGSSGQDAFVSKLNATGSGLVYSTYLGGSQQEGASGLALDGNGNAYVTGQTNSDNFPITPDAFQGDTVLNAGAYVTKLNASGSNLLFSSYLPGTGGSVIATDSSGDAYVAGTINTAAYPAPSSYDAFVTKLALGAFVIVGPRTSVEPTSSTWYSRPVTVRLTATDPDSPITATFYSLDGGADLIYTGPFQVGDGIHQLSFYSVDAAGHRETRHGQSFKVDTTAPISRVAPLPAVAPSPNFLIQWSASDATSGLQIFYTSIYVSDNGGPFKLLLQAPAGQYWFRGSLGHTYSFYSVALDQAGNWEVKTVADTTTQVPAQMAADVNGDGQINCADIAIVKASFGKRTGQPGFDPRADVNQDGVVDVRDLMAVSQKLIPATTCP